MPINLSTRNRGIVIVKLETRAKLWEKLLLPIMLIIFISGCVGQPKGWESLRELSNNEKDRIVKIALNTPEVLKQLETNKQYKASDVDWIAIVWDNSQWSAYWRIRSEWETDPNYNLVSESAVFYPATTIVFGDPEDWQITVAVDLDTEKSVFVQECPAQKGPQIAEAKEVTFEQLFSAPEEYGGKDIVIEGYYYQGWETIVLCEELVYSGNAPGHLIPKGKMLWIENGVPREIYDSAYQQQMMGPLERYARVRIKGKFEYGGKYGHLGGLDSQIIPSEVVLVPWSPPAE
ncbi:MAG: hypothetical protein ACYSSN_11500 [Planctomycetota bacterium]